MFRKVRPVAKAKVAVASQEHAKPPKELVMPSSQENANFLFTHIAPKSITTDGLLDAAKETIKQQIRREEFDNILVGYCKDSRKCLFFAQLSNISQDVADALQNTNSLWFEIWYKPVALKDLEYEVVMTCMITVGDKDERVEVLGTLEKGELAIFEETKDLATV
jgi:hypothetical protein